MLGINISHTNILPNMVDNITHNKNDKLDQSPNWNQFTVSIAFTLLNISVTMLMHRDFALKCAIGGSYHNHVKTTQEKPIKYFTL